MATLAVVNALQASVSYTTVALVGDGIEVVNAPQASVSYTSAG